MDIAATGREERDDIRNFVSLSDSAKRYLCENLLLNLFGQIVRHLRLNETWCDRVHQNVPARKLLG